MFDATTSVSSAGHCDFVSQCLAGHDLSDGLQLGARLLNGTVPVPLSLTWMFLLPDRSLCFCSAIFPGYIKRLLIVYCLLVMTQLWDQEKIILFSWNDAHGRTTLNSALLSINQNNVQVVSHSDDFREISEIIEHVVAFDSDHCTLQQVGEYLIAPSFHANKLSVGNFC